MGNRQVKSEEKIDENSTEVNYGPVCRVEGKRWTMLGTGTTKCIKSYIPTAEFRERTRASAPPSSRGFVSSLFRRLRLHALLDSEARDTPSIGRSATVDMTGRTRSRPLQTAFVASHGLIRTYLGLSPSRSLRSEHSDAIMDPALHDAETHNVDKIIWCRAN
jgi:hypothetical protein